MKKRFDCPLTLKNWEDDGTFSGYASVFDITDSQGEEVAPGAFDFSLRTWAQAGKMPKLLWQHDYRQPIGFWQEIYEDTYGLFVKGKLLFDLTQGREAYSLLKNNIIDGLSIGFITVKSRRSDNHKKRSSIRILEEVHLQEISLVTFAANPQAKVEQVKMQDPSFHEFIRQLNLLEFSLRQRDKLP